MDRRVRRKLEMASRVRDFSRAHPSADANYAPVLAKLEERIVRMESLAQQQQGGYLARHAAVARRRALRRRIQVGLLRHLVTVAEVAAKDAPQVAERFKLPAASATAEAFRTLARKMLEQGQAQKELLMAHGLSDHLLEDLAAALDEYDGSLAESNGGLRDHIGARAELAAVSREVMDLVDLLDGLNRYRFGSDAELRAAWESARNIVSGPRAVDAGEGTGTGAGTGAPSNGTPSAAGATGAPGLATPTAAFGAGAGVGGSAGAGGGAVAGEVKPAA